MLIKASHDFPFLRLRSSSTVGINLYKVDSKGKSSAVISQIYFLELVR
jgi:hypothetical protein